MVWDNVFQNMPVTSDRGFVTAPNLRYTKSLFKSMFSIEHNFDDSEEPIVTHKVGECTVVDIEGEPKTEARAGLVFDDETLFLDQGFGTLTPVSTLRHDKLNNRLLDSAHNQYELNSDVDITGRSTEFERIVGLRTDRSVNHYISADWREVVSQQEHLTNDPVLGAHHRNNATGFFPSHPFPNSQKVVPGPVSDFEKVTTTTESTVREDALISMPVPAPDTSSRVIIRASSNNFNDFFPNFNLHDADGLGSEDVYYWRYKLSNKIVYVDITSNVTNLSYDSSVSSLGVSSGDILWVRINSGVIVGSTSTGIPSFVVESSFPNFVGLVIENHGLVLGRGGDGGSASSTRSGSNPSCSGSDGDDGGDAMHLNHSTLLFNFGTIGGGGGGGGGAAAYTETSFGGGAATAVGGSGGQGSQNSSGGSASASHAGSGDENTRNGNSGTATSPGSGRSHTSSSANAWGGGGGSLGNSGANGQASTASGSYAYACVNVGAGGSGGRGIVGEEYLTRVTFAVGTIPGGVW